MANTAQGMFDSLQNKGSSSPQEGSAPISTMFSGQSQNDGTPNSTMFGGQSQGSGGNAKAALGIADKITEGAATKALSSTEAGKTVLKYLLFYGGETVTQIKSNSNYKVKVIGGSEGIKNTPDDIKFYKNVTIPRKKV